MSASELQRALREKTHECKRLREAVMFARYELDNVQRSVMNADDHLRRAAVSTYDEGADPLDWIC